MQCKNGRNGKREFQDAPSTAKMAAAERIHALAKHGDWPAVQDEARALRAKHHLGMLAALSMRVARLAWQPRGSVSLMRWWGYMQRPD